MHNIEKDYSKTVLSQIPHLNNSKEKNFMLIKNSDDYYINPVCNNLKPLKI